jgi:hypothetical protein
MTKRQRVEVGLRLAPHLRLVGRDLTEYAHRMKVGERRHPALRALADVAAGVAVVAFTVIVLVPNVLAIYGLLLIYSH